ncbi:MAG TPA: hypothetical protein DDW27_15390, partial [Bacteroidales bacterium]|nr:hypothetical protein [Bacteroidales bacterium]
MKKKICTLLVFIFFSIRFIQSQDYLINFNGTGATTTVESVKVENITQGTEVTLSGNEVLHLVSVVTGIDQIIGDNGD